MTQTLKFVVDPMCAWCWAMAPHIDATLETFDGRVAFDLAVAGINIRTMKPLTKSGLKRLDVQWCRVAAVTGQHFSHRLPEEMIFNSQLPCLAVEAMRTLTKAPPFAYVRYLQRLLFVDGVNINDIEVLRDACEELSANSDLLVGLMGKKTGDGADAPSNPHRPELWHECVAERIGERRDGEVFRLFARGFVDADQLKQDIETWLAH